MKKSSKNRTSVFQSTNKKVIYPDSKVSASREINRNFIKMLDKSKESTISSEDPYYPDDLMKIVQNFDFERLKKGVFPISPKLLM